LPKARTFYRSWERELGTDFYRDRKVWRFFQSEKEAELWRRKRETGELAPYVRDLPETLGIELRPQMGGFEVEEAAYLDVAEVLRRFRAELRERGCLAEEKLALEDLRWSVDGVEWKGMRTERIIFCEG